MSSDQSVWAIDLLVAARSLPGEELWSVRYCVNWSVFAVYSGSMASGAGRPTGGCLVNRQCVLDSVLHFRE